MKNYHTINHTNSLKKIRSFLLFAFMIPFFSFDLFAQEKPFSYQDLQYPFPVKMAQLSPDMNVAYVDEGKGETVLLFIHGLGSYLPAWKHNISSLSSDYRCIALDLPGYGKSDKRKYPITMHFYADVVKKLIDYLQLRNVVLVGHSMGGQIAIHTAMRYPESVQKLVLAAPAGFELFTEGEKQWFRDNITLATTLHAGMQQIRTNLAVNFYNFPEDAEFMFTDRVAMRKAPDFPMYAHAVQKSIIGMVDLPVYHLLDKVQQQTLIIFGEYDNLIPNRFMHGGTTYSAVIDGIRKMPRATSFFIENAGHFIQYEKPTEFNARIRQFLMGSK